MKDTRNKRSKDVNELAKFLVDSPTGEHNTDIPLPSKQQISSLMAVLGRKGGKIGGKRRLETMTANERSEIAAKAANSRWSARKRHAED